MTSMAFGLGVLPLAIASGAGSASQRAIGSGVLGGMLTGTALAVFFVPIFFVVVRGIFRGSERQRRLHAHAFEPELPPGATRGDQVCPAPVFPPRPSPCPLCPRAARSPRRTSAPPRPCPAPFPIPPPPAGRPPPSWSGSGSSPTSACVA